MIENAPPFAAGDEGANLSAEPTGASAGMSASDGTLEPRRIQLASEPPITFGALKVEPMLRRISQADGREDFIEPRVMQVLVALLRADGGVVSRDELLQSCWNGAVVGEDAIDRVIGRIRRLTERFDGLRLETVTKVGYRLLHVGERAAPGDEPAAAGRPPSICVLPFLNMSDDPQQTYFSDGMTEDVITDLSKVSAVSVLARTTSFGLRNVTDPATDLASRLGVTHLLEGSVRKSGGRVRVTAQLIDGATGAHLWAERYDRDVADLFALQDELSCAIVEALRVRLLPEEKRAIEQRGTHHSEAYELYLLARRYYQGAEMDGGDIHRLDAIARLCRRAVTLDPDYAHAWTLIGAAQTALMCHTIPPREGGREAIEQALALDPNQAEPYAIKARFLLQDGAMEEARRQLDIALGLDPASALVRAVNGRYFYVKRDFAAAIPELEYAMGASDIWVSQSGILLSSYKAVGDEAGLQAAARRTLAIAEKVLDRDYVSISAIASAVDALACLGERDRARTLVERGLLIDPDNMRMRYNFACVLSGFLGDHDFAVTLLEPVLAGCMPGLLRHMAIDPDLEGLRDDPRFAALVSAARARLDPDAQVEATTHSAHPGERRHPS